MFVDIIIIVAYEYYEVSVVLPASIHDLAAE